MPDSKKLKKWEVLDRKEIFSAPPWITLYMDTIRLPQGRVIEDFYHVKLPSYVMVCARTEAGEFLLVRQYKHSLADLTVLFPAGFLEEGEAPETAAQRELREETGYEAKNWDYLGQFAVDGTKGCGNAHFFIAQGLAKVAQPLADEAEQSEILFYTTEKMIEGIKNKEISLLSAVTLFILATSPLVARLKV